MLTKTELVLCAAIILSTAFPASAATKHYRVIHHRTIYNMVPDNGRCTPSGGPACSGACLPSGPPCDQQIFGEVTTSKKHPITETGVREVKSAASATGQEIPVVNASNDRIVISAQI
jgi:hypothetical protein